MYLKNPGSGWDPGRMGFDSLSRNGPTLVRAVRGRNVLQKGRHVQCLAAMSEIIDASKTDSTRKHNNY